MQNKTVCATIKLNGLFVDKINEEALIDSSKNNAVENLEIKQTENGAYQLIIKLAWKAHPSILMTSRDAVKEWANYDRLINHIKNNYSEIPQIKVTLNYKFLRKKTLLLASITEFNYDEVLIKSK